MDAKDQELYAEEQRTALFGIEAGISKLLEKYQAPSSEVTATIDNDTLTVDVSNEKFEVEVSNEKDLEPALKAMAEKIVKAVETAKTEKIEVTNLKDIEQRDTIKISNLETVEDLLGDLLDKEFNVTVKQDAPKFPITAKEAMSVRLSDGKSFYKALGGLQSAIQRLPTVISTVTGEQVLAVANADGTPIEGGTTTPPADGSFDGMDGNDLYFMDGNAMAFMSG